ncbi:hypothetical protein [Bordetella avium]|uniref:hypothetical protein n=1 Tax=Bordetella avium TaxID=521 RepID=UPI0015F8CBD9|nr:hypothetical protein [Bordetella avium]
MSTTLKRRIDRLEANHAPSPTSPNLPSEIWLSAPGGDEAVLLWRRDDESH